MKTFFKNIFLLCFLLNLSSAGFTSENSRQAGSFKNTLDTLNALRNSPLSIAKERVVQQRSSHQELTLPTQLKDHLVYFYKTFEATNYYNRKKSEFYNTIPHRLLNTIDWYSSSYCDLVRDTPDLGQMVDHFIENTLDGTVPDQASQMLNTLIENRPEYKNQFTEIYNQGWAHYNACTKRIDLSIVHEFFLKQYKKNEIRKYGAFLITTLGFIGGFKIGYTYFASKIFNKISQKFYFQNSNRKQQIFKESIFVTTGIISGIITGALTFCLGLGIETLLTDSI